jgi:hypothetical protein
MEMPRPMPNCLAIYWFETRWNGNRINSFARLVPPGRRSLSLRPSEILCALRTLSAVGEGTRLPFSPLPITTTRRCWSRPPRRRDRPHWFRQPGHDRRPNRAALTVGRARDAAPMPFPGHRVRAGRRAAGMKMRSRSCWLRERFRVSWGLRRCFPRGLRCRFRCGFFAGLPLLLRSEFLLDCRGDGVNIHLVHLRGITENLRRVG